MANNLRSHSKPNGLANQANQANYQKREKMRGVILQDKSAPMTARIASRQPVPPRNAARSHTMRSNFVRAQNTPSTKRKTVSLTLWVDPIVKAKLEKRAKDEKISISATGTTYLKIGMQQDADIHYSAFLEPILEKGMDRRMQALGNRLAALLVRIAFDAGQTRAIATNILANVPGITQATLSTILQESEKTARNNIIHRSPQVAELIQLLTTWLTEEQAKGKKEEGNR
jgi:hypothetical protein